MWLQGLLLLTPLLHATSPLTSISVPSDHTSALFWALLGELQQLERFQTLLLFNCELSNTAHTFVTDIWRQLQVSTLILTRVQTFQLKRNCNDKLLALVCLERAEINHTKPLQNLAEKLQHKRHTRIILLLSTTTQIELEQQSIIENYFRHCLTLKMPNVIALLPNSAQHQTIFTFEIFPAFKLLRRGFKRGINYFPDKLRDMHGQPLYTIPDQNLPRTHLYWDSAGQLRMIGYIAELMRTFAQQRNATLVFPFPVQIGASIHVTHLQNFTRLGLIDVATGLGTFSTQQNPDEHTRIVEYSSWMLMLPLERDLEVHELFLHIFRSDLLLCLFILGLLLSLMLNAFHSKRHQCVWFELFFNDKSFRGVLAQAFPLKVYNNLKISWILSMIFLTGLIMNCLLTVYLKTFLTQPPTQPRINNYDDLLRSETKVLITDTERGLLQNSKGEQFWEHYENAFDVITSWPEFVNRRISLIVSHAYPIPTMLWDMIEKRQSVFQRKLFRIEPNMCLEQSIIFSLPVQENSIYLQALNRYIIAVQETGLLQHWSTMTFHDLVAIGVMSIEDLSTARRYEGIVLGDLYWVWIIFGMAFALCIVVFFVELLVYKFQRRSLKGNV